MKPPAGTRVLIVEDEAIIAMTAEDMIQDLGCIIAGIASSVAEALAQAEAGGFDVAMLDINLRGETSIPVAELLAARGTPFIFTTGYGSTGPAASFIGVPIVSKPYRTDQIGLAISQVVPS